MFLPPPQSPGEMRPTPPGGSSGPYARVIEALDKGVLPENIRSHLIATGYTPEQAKKIVDYAVRWRSAYSGGKSEPNSQEPAGVRLSGQRNQTMGILLVVFGIAITMGTCVLASYRGSGSVVFVGIIIGGIALFFRGSNQVAQARQMEEYASSHPNAEDWDEPIAPPSNVPPAATVEVQDWDKPMEAETTEPPEAMPRRSRLGRRPPRL